MDLSFVFVLLIIVGAITEARGRWQCDVCFNITPEELDWIVCLLFHLLLQDFVFCFRVCF